MTVWMEALVSRTRTWVSARNVDQEFTRPSVMPSDETATSEIIREIREAAQQV